MILVGCDLHTRKQQVALLNTETGELWDQELSHDGDAIERFYATLPPPVTVGIESTGYSLWFHALLQAPGAHPAGGRGREDPRDGRPQDQNRSARRPASPGPSEGRPLSSSLDSGSGDPRPARAHQTPAPTRPYPHDGQKRSARNRPQPTAGPRPLALVARGPGPTARARAPAAHLPAPR